MNRRTSSLLASLALVLLTALANADTGSDTRQAIPVTAEAREHVLSEMRMLLESVHLVLDAALKKDMETVAVSAEKVGLGAMTATPAEITKQLPKEFKMMGRGVHEAMDMIAKDARDLGDSQHTLQQLSDTLGNCVACHATFKLK